MSQIIHGPPKIWGPGQLPDLPPPLKPALAVTTSYHGCVYMNLSYIII